MDYMLLQGGGKVGRGEMIVTPDGPKWTARSYVRWYKGEGSCLSVKPPLSGRQRGARGTDRWSGGVCTKKVLACMVAGYASKKVGALIEFPRSVTPGTGG